ncbi:MAG: phosphatase [Treponema sp.]|jgi:putative hydrolase|nr:phosphatase [Treponema sp.]
MKIAIDTHTHSTASGHAYSTLDELARGARKRRLQGFVLTDHGPAMPGGPHPYHFSNMRILPHHIGGVLFFRGVEANITGEAGNIDLAPEYLRGLDLVMAGFHEICFAPRSREENTAILINALKNPWVDGVSHPGNPAFPVDLDAAARAGAEYGKFLEINNSSFRVRPGSEEHCRALARLCRERGCLVSCGSDAHYQGDVGNFTKARQVIIDAGIPPELVINSSLARFKAFSQARRAARQTAGRAL